MKQEHHRKVAGLWLDHQNALVITTPDYLPHGEYGIVEKLKAHHHAFHSSSNENASNHQRHAEAEKFYREICTRLHPYDEVLVFGPGKAQEELANHARKDKQMQSKKLVVEPADRLTENQMTAHVAGYFKKYAF